MLKAPGHLTYLEPKNVLGVELSRLQLTQVSTSFWDCCHDLWQLWGETKKRSGLLLKFSFLGESESPKLVNNK